MELEQLLIALELIQASPLPDNPEANLNAILDGEQIREIVTLADRVLILPTGGNNWDAHEILETRGFPVRAGETDRFGWLSGVIHTGKGMIIYG